MTPEGKVKACVDATLKAYAPLVWYYKPVSLGMGAHGVPDYVGAAGGRMFAVETKAKGKKPTALQEMCMKKITEAGGKCFVIDGDKGLSELTQWLKETL